MRNRILPILGRAAITILAFWWIFRSVDLRSLYDIFRASDKLWLLIGVALYFAAQFGCIARWKLLVPNHAALTYPFLANSFYVGAFFSTFLPTTVGGDVVRSYDLIKATGQWREPLASVLMDRLVGLVGLTLFAAGAWFLYPPARTDPVLRNGFFGFCLVVTAALLVLSSRRVLNSFLKPFGKIGLGQLQSHAKQFQESLLAYLRKPQRLLAALGISMGIQVLAIGMFAAVTKALGLPIPILLLILIVPIIFMVSQIPVSLSGWGVREGATILFLKPIGIEPAQALSLSLICAFIPILAGLVGGILFLARKRRPKRA